MKLSLLSLGLLGLLVVGCNNDNNQGTSTSPNDIQREEDVTGGSLNTGTSDYESSEDAPDLGTNRGAGSAAGSNDAAGMGMDE